MSNAVFEIPIAVNEPVLSYAPGSPEKKSLKAALKAMKAEQVDIPMYIGGKKVHSDEKISIHPPHEINHTLGVYSKGNKTHIEVAINAALAAKEDWADMPWQERAAIFLKAADLLSGPYRAKMNAATMLCQSKSAFQAEIDAVCELADFFRFNVQYMIDIYSQQPESTDGIWN